MSWSQGSVPIPSCPPLMFLHCRAIKVMRGWQGPKAYKDCM